MQQFLPGCIDKSNTARTGEGRKPCERSENISSMPISTPSQPLKTPWTPQQPGNQVEHLYLKPLVSRTRRPHERRNTRNLSVIVRRGLLASDLYGHHYLLSGATAEFAALHGHLSHPGLRSTRRDRRKSSGPRPTSYLSPWRRRPHVRHTKNHDGRRKQPRSANHLRRQRRIWRNLQQRNRTRHRAHHCEPLPTRLGKVSGGLRRARIFRKTLTPFKTPSRRHCASTGPR